MRLPTTLLVPPLLFLVLALAGAACFLLQGVLWLASVPFWLLRRGRTWITDHRAVVLYSAAAILAGTVFLYGVYNHGTELFPDVAPREIWVDLEFPSGTNLDAQDDLVRSLETRLGDTADRSSLLSVIAQVYGGAVKTRETFYKKGVFKSRRLPCTVISIGNLTVGER